MNAQLPLSSRPIRPSAPRGMDQGKLREERAQPLVIPTEARNERSGGISRVVSPAEIPRLRSQAHYARDGRGMHRQAHVAWDDRGNSRKLTVLTLRAPRARDD